LQLRASDQGVVEWRSGEKVEAEDKESGKRNNRNMGDGRRATTKKKRPRRTGKTSDKDT
jgi:hypothetical protein